MNNIPMKNSALTAIAAKRVAQENGTKTIDPPIKRSQTTDPDTGAITYRQSWSNTSSSKSRSASKSPSISTVGSKVKSTKTVTPASREVTSVPVPTPAKKTESSTPLAKIQTSNVKKDAKTILYEKQKKEGETREQYEARNKIEQQRVNKNSAEAKAPRGSGGSILTDKNKGATCKTC
jgi:hypothetical protein